MQNEGSREPMPGRVELTRIELRRSHTGHIQVRRGDRPGVTSTNQLLDGLQAGEELAVVEFWQLDRDGWAKEKYFREELLKAYPSTFMLQGKPWHLIGGTINQAGRGELLACTNRSLLHRLVPGWREMDGLNRVKCLSRLMQPSITGNPFTLRLLVVDDPVHDGDAILSESGVNIMRQAFGQPEAGAFKCISHWLKVVLRTMHPKWDELPEIVTQHHRHLFHQGQPIDGVLFLENVKLYKDQFKHSQIIELTEQDIRLHATEHRTNMHRAGLSRQLLQYLPASFAEPLVAASDIPLNGSSWARALTGDVEALKYILHHDPDDNAEEHEIRSQLIRHLEAGCTDVSIPYLRQRVLPMLAGAFKNRIRKGRAPGAYLYVAPSTRLGRYEISVPTRMLSHEERDVIAAGGSMEVMATRYPITGHQSINRMTVAGMHRGAVVYVNPEVWVQCFQGDFDGDCITILRVNPGDWQNSEPFIPPATEKPKPVSFPKALEQAATSKRDVALGESVVADFIHLQWEQNGKLNPDELNELGVRVICAAVDRAKHGTVPWGLSADEFARSYLPERFRHRHSILASKYMPDAESPETELRSRLWLLKEGGFTAARSGWELVLSLMHGWTKDAELLPMGNHDRLYQRVQQLCAELPPPCRQTFEIVRLARRKWAQAVDHWKKTGDDTQMRSFTERFQAWINRTDETLVRKVLLELGKQLLRPKRAGNASLFWSQIPLDLLRRVYQ